MLIAFVLDFFIRAGFYYQIEIVVACESFLFLFFSLIAFLVAKRDRTNSFEAQRFDLWLALFFLLGGIRSMLWTLNFDIYIANIIIFFLGIVIGIVLIRWQRRNRTAD